MYAEVRTAFSVAEALNIGERFLFPKGDGCVDGVCGDLDVVGLFNVLCDLAHAVWSPDNGVQSRADIAVDVLARTNIGVSARGLEKDRTPCGVTLELVSAGVGSGLRKRWQEYFAGSASRDAFAVDREFMVRVAEEGVLDWALRCATNPDFEVRRCLCCGEWFLPQRAGRSRFCTARCRNVFHFLKVDEAFICVHCGQRHSIQQWSGLIYDRAANRIAIDHYDQARRICCNCIANDFSVWERYVAPGVAALKYTRSRTPSRGVPSARRSRP
jgi:hypothetical protein